MFSRIATVVVVVFCAVALAAAQTPAKYVNLELVPFEAAKGIDFPPDFQAQMITSLVKHFTNSKRFAKIIRPGEASSSSPETLKLSGIVTEVDEGSRAARALVGFGAGSSYMKAKIKFADAGTNEVKLEAEVKGTYKGTFGGYGGDASKVTDGLAKQIVKLVKDKKL